MLIHIVINALDFLTKRKGKMFLKTVTFKLKATYSNLVIGISDQSVKLFSFQNEMIVGGFNDSAFQSNGSV